MIDQAIAAPLAAALTAKGYETLTAVQQAVLAPEAQGRDVLVSAQTGSGKTVAFGIAIADQILAGQDKLLYADSPLALVIAPTRELALQVARELEWLYASAGAQIATCVGGMDYRSEKRALDRGAHIVVGTPGRLRDHIDRKSLDLSGLRAAVLDEADEMLQMGFVDDIEWTPVQRQRNADGSESVVRHPWARSRLTGSGSVVPNFARITSASATLIAIPNCSPVLPSLGMLAFDVFGR